MVQPTSSSVPALPDLGLAKAGRRVRLGFRLRALVLGLTRPRHLFANKAFVNRDEASAHTARISTMRRALKYDPSLRLGR